MMNGSRKNGERAELGELRGFGEAENIMDAFRDVEVMAEGTKADNALFHVQVRLPDYERLSPERWLETADRIENRLGLNGQPRAVYFHINDKTGERHMHIGFSLIDAETMTAKPLPYFKFRLKSLARQLELEFDLTLVPNQREGPIKFAPTKAQDEQARRLGVDIHAIRNTIRACWDRSDCGRSFDGALADEGLILAQGTRRDYVVIDHAGGLHALGKRTLDVTAAQVRARLGDLDREHMPTIEQAREFMLDLPRDRTDKLERELTEVQKQIAAEQEYARRDPVRDEIAWEEALAKAAIEKEKVERQFVEPKDREKEAGAGREQTQPGRREEVKWPSFEKEATDAIRNERTESLKGPAAQVWAAWQKIDNDKVSAAALAGESIPFPTREVFAAALDEKGIAFAAVTGEEAYRSQREADFAKAIGNRAPRFTAGEIVIVTEPRPEYRRNGAIIETSRIQKLDQALAEKFVKHLGTRSKLQGIDATLKLSDERARLRRSDRETARLERAQDIKDFSYIVTNKIKTPAVVIGRVAGIGVPAIGKALDVIGGLVESIAAPTLTPQQKHEGEKAKDRREAEADFSIDFSRVTAEAAQERQQHDSEREAERQRDGGGRER
jgi:hypothetical protein